MHTRRQFPRGGRCGVGAPRVASKCEGIAAPPRREESLRCATKPARGRAQRRAPSRRRVRRARGKHWQTIGTATNQQQPLARRALVLVAPSHRCARAHRRSETLRRSRTNPYSRAVGPRARNTINPSESDDRAQMALRPADTRGLMLNPNSAVRRGAERSGDTRRNRGYPLQRGRTPYFALRTRGSNCTSRYPPKRGNGPPKNFCDRYGELVRYRAQAGAGGHWRRPSLACGSGAAQRAAAAEVVGLRRLAAPSCERQSWSLGRAAQRRACGGGARRGGGAAEALLASPASQPPPTTTTARCEGEGAARRLCSTLGSIRWGGHGRRLTRARRRGCRTARGSRYGRGAGEMASERVRRPGAADPAGPRAAPSRSRRTRRTRGAAQARSRPDCSSRSPSAPRGQASACRRRRSARTSDGLCTCVIKR